jgi:hypothetical protein
MAGRSVLPPKPKPPVLTVGQKRRRIERLQKCMQRIEAFDPQKVQRRVGVPEVLALEAAIDKALSSAFGYGTPAYLRYNLAATLDHGLITNAALVSNVVSPVGGPRRREAQVQEARQYFSEGKERSIALLREAICTLESEIAHAQPVAQAAQESKGVADADHSPPGAAAAEATQKAAEVRTLQRRQRGGIDLKAAWCRVGRWWRGGN